MCQYTIVRVPNDALFMQRENDPGSLRAASTSAKKRFVVAGSTRNACAGWPVTVASALPSDQILIADAAVFVEPVVRITAPSRIGAADASAVAVRSAKRARQVRIDMFISQSFRMGETRFLAGGFGGAGKVGFDRAAGAAAPPFDSPVIIMGL